MLNFDKWIYETFQSAIDGIKECDPVKDRLEWEFYWNVILIYKTHRERKNVKEKQ